jgi:hypothetical protein
MARHRILARTVLAQRLPHEQCQRPQRRVDPITILARILLHRLFQLMGGKHIVQFEPRTLYELLPYAPHLIKQAFFWYSSSGLILHGYLS